MDSIEYGKLVGLLDQQIEEEKRRAEDKARRDEIEQKIKLRAYWIQGLEKRREELAKYGAKPAIEIDTILAPIRAEKDALERQLLGPLPEALTVDMRREMELLVEEVGKSDLSTLEEDERWTVFEVWATRWRLITSQVEESVPQKDGMVRCAYAKIVETMAAFKEKEKGRYIAALDKAKRHDWALVLADAKRRLASFGEERKKERELEEQADATFRALVGACQSYLAGRGEEGEKELRHRIRNAAKYPHLREEVARLVLPFKEELVAEFGFLWQKDQIEEPLPALDRKMSNRDIVARLLRRLKSKSLIGACHGPVDMVVQGFAGHDLGRSKDAVETLVKGGILRHKRTDYGERVSIEKKMIQRVDAFLSGEPTGIRPVDEWCANGNGH